MPISIAPTRVPSAYACVPLRTTHGLLRMFEDILYFVPQASLLSLALDPDRLVPIYMLDDNIDTNVTFRIALAEAYSQWRSAPITPSDAFRWRYVHRPNMAQEFKAPESHRVMRKNPLTISILKFGRDTEDVRLFHWDYEDRRP